MRWEKKDDFQVVILTENRHGSQGGHPPELRAKMRIHVTRLKRNGPRLQTVLLSPPLSTRGSR